jgi:hypothetical protein
LVDARPLSRRAIADSVDRVYIAHNGTSSRYGGKWGGSGMYWDVVEVKPGPDYRLLVRFADGSGGWVQLAPEDFTGVLAPLREPSFFKQVFVDRGAVAWPGEIELAPDAMYRQTAGERR